MTDIGKRARAAGAVLGQAPTAAKNAALRAAAKALRANAAKIKTVNAEEMAAARAEDLTSAMLDRLLLDDKRIEGMAKSLEEIADLSDPVGTEIARWSRPNGLDIARVRTPLGVVGIIYESRPNVTADAGGLCLKSGNAAILRGGKESLRSSAEIVACLHEGLKAAGLPADAIQMIPTTDRAAVGAMLRLNEYIDVIVPRGGKGLIERVIAESRIPLFQHLEGNCHTYVDGAADLVMARKILINAKLRRTGVCGATETLLVDRKVAGSHLPALVKDLLDGGCEVRGDDVTRGVDVRVKPATEDDYYTEYLDAIIAVKVVDGVGEAIAHIGKYGSHHTEAIITADAGVATRFLNEIDSAIVLHNASTQFADGGEFGMGAEIGISTGRLHARGPVGVEQLTIFKYVVRGAGQVRP
jgi:glutamate-5-semialdehyde dehydrogenase